MEQFSVIHTKLRIAVNHLSFKFELDDGNSLVHLGNQFHMFLFHRLVLSCLWFKEAARIFTIHLHRKSSQREKIDSVSIFQSGEIAVSEAHPQYICDTSFAARRGSHPDKVMVAPLNVKVVIVAQQVHYYMCSRTSVVYVSNYVQVVNS